jgi:hypothetical protein
MNFIAMAALAAVGKPGINSLLVLVSNNIYMYVFVFHAKKIENSHACHLHLFLSHSLRTLPSITFPPPPLTTAVPHLLREPIGGYCCQGLDCATLAT